MSDAVVSPSKKVIELCGSNRSLTIDALMAFERTLWRLTVVEPEEKTLHQDKSERRYLDSQRLVVLLTEELSRLGASIPLAKFITVVMGKLTADGHAGQEDEDYWFDISLFQPVTLLSAILVPEYSSADLNYGIRRNIRWRYQCVQSFQVVQLFSLLAKITNSATSRRLTLTNPDWKRVWNYKDDYRPVLEKTLKDLSKPGNVPLDAKIARDTDLFVECCRYVGFIRSHYMRRKIVIQTPEIDAEFLLTSLFGLPTDIRGFDELIGGGVMLTEAPSQDYTGPLFPGRTLLINGRFGTGKTLLALQVAMEVARKGGLVWFMPLEHSIQECFYMLDSMHLRPQDDSVEIVTSAFAAARVLGNPSSACGALIMLKTIKNSYEDFLVAFEENADLMQSYPLRLIIADPVNSVLDVKTHDQEAVNPYPGEHPISQRRSKTMAMFERVKQQGTNILLVAEEIKKEHDPLDFVQYIADTVINLSVDRRENYAQRYFEILKSRFQRELRGEHPYSINSGKGICIYPSSSAVSARLRPRHLPVSKENVCFGVPSLDDLLGNTALRRGDVIVFQGPHGSLKTHLGMLFLSGTDKPRVFKSVSLLVTMESDAPPKTDGGYWNTAEHKQKQSLRICSIPHGHVDPGFVLQQIEDEFTAAFQQGMPIDRVMVDNIALMELACPFLRADDTFGDTLVDLIRRHGATSLFICDEMPAGSKSSIQLPILHNADSIFQFHRIEFHGTQRIMLNVQKTHGMRHRRDAFELIVSEEGLQVIPSSVMLQVGPMGEYLPLKVKLFLHAESDMQEQYNIKFVSAIETVSSGDIQLDSPDQTYAGRVRSIGFSSVLDEMQIVQLDEFEVNNSVHGENYLTYFPQKVWEEHNHEWDDFLPDLKKRVTVGNNRFFAVPFYENISLLAYRADSPNDPIHKACNSWGELARLCTGWQKNNPDRLFFDFPRITSENYNCLFFEILLSLEEFDWSQHVNVCQLSAWLSPDRPKVIEASKIYRTLCQRTYFSGNHNDPNATGARIRNNTLSDHAGDPTMHSTGRGRKTIFHDVDRTAIVWRHWYSTLNHMMAQFGTVEERQKIRVRALPGDISIAGEWYLGIPTSSAAPDIGLEMIRLLTSREADLDRLLSGVGLPTRQSFYFPDEHANMETATSSYVDISRKVCYELIQKAFRRSDYGCYPMLSKALALSLKRVIEIPKESTDKEQTARIEFIFHDLQAKIRFLRTEGACSRCHVRKKE